MMKRLNAIAAMTLLLGVSACGFRPIYATPDVSAPVIREIAVMNVAAPESLAPYIADALTTRMAPGEGITPRYELHVRAGESAERLAVQIDATVTRYNYRLDARYWVTDATSGERFGGQARAVTSYNIVSSQYSTLFAERTAIEKAARLLAEEIERDLLIRFAETPDERKKMIPEAFDSELGPSELLSDPRRGGVIEPVIIDASRGAPADKD